MLEYIMGTDIKEGPRTSEITGLNYRNFNDDIITQYGTTTPGKYMFRRVNSYKFITDNFFLLELEFLIQQILQSKNIWSRRRDIYDLQTKLRTKTWIKDTHNLQLGTVDEAKLKRVFKMKPYPTQLEFLKHYPVIKKSHHLKGLLLDSIPGSGKAQPLYTKIKVPGGWSTMGDMYVGAKVIARDGTVTKVTGVHPQGVTKVYRVHFGDGRYTDCHPEHLWKVYDTRGPKTNRMDRGKVVRTDEEVEANRWCVIDTNELIKRFNRKEHRLYVPLCEPEQNKDIKLLMDPYLLGVILGDGGVSGGTPLISKPYQQLFDKVQSLLPDWMECSWRDDITFSLRRKTRKDTNTVTDSLGKLDLMGLRSWEKFIPQEYFEGSKEQRLALLQGLLDTDGTVDTQKTVSFSSSSKALAEGVQYLVRSLGGIAKLVTRTPHFTYKGERKEGRMDYRVHIRYPRPEELFTLDHKKERALPTQYSDILKLRVVNIEEIESTETQCITVEHGEHLYVTDDFIVTHNTATSLMWGVLNGNAKHIIICPSATLADAWLTHINEKAFHVAPKVWTTRDGKIPTPDADYYIFHNEFTRTDEFFGYLSMIFKYANGKGVDLVVDECHNFNELSSKQTQNLIEAVDKFPFNDALPMSGTPLKQMAREAYTVFAMIDNFFVGAARERFTKSYGLSRDKLNALLARRIGRLKYTIDALVGLEHKEPDVVSIPVSFPGAEQYTLKNIGNRMTEFIQERIKFYELHMPEFIQFYNHVVDDYELSIKDNMSAMSELLRYKQIVNKFRKQGFSSFTDNEDSKFAKKVEAKIESGLRGEALKQFRNVKSAVKYVGLKIRGEALGLVLSRARMEAIRDTIAHAGLPKLIDDAEKKTIIFTSYVSALEECEQQLRAVGFKPVTIYGENNKDRDASLKLLRDDPTINPAITTFDSLREGVNGTMANQEIFLNAPWRDYEMKQAKARIYRQGQDVPVKFWMINLDTGNEPNITSRSVDIMEWSKEQTEILLGRSSILNAEMRTIMGAEDYDIIDEELTRPLIRSRASVLSLF